MEKQLTYAWVTSSGECGKSPGGKRTGSGKSSFDDRLKAWNDRLMEQGALNGEDGDGDEPTSEDGTVLEVVQEMADIPIE